MLKKYIFLAVFFISAYALQAQETSSSVIEKEKVLEQINYYKSLFEVESLNSKIVDNFGNGFEELYGLRNMRPVLHGIVYRGGANNYYHKTAKRDNHNPLPDDGLNNLCDAGFSKAVYLYAKNFSTAPAMTVNNNSDTLRYYNNTLGTRAEQKELLDQVYSIITGKTSGPIYLHCWNGWHQSGFASAIILMQFCGLTNAEALEYWKANADGGIKGYDHVIKAIKEFRIFDGYSIDQDVKAAMCLSK